MRNDGEEPSSMRGDPLVKQLARACIMKSDKEEYLIISIGC